MNKELFAAYVLPVIMAALAAFAGWLGTQLKKLVQKYIDNKTKESVVRTCVKAAEQIYKDLKGNDKLQKVKENIVAMLNENGLTISELEMDMLIEAAVAEMNKQINKESVENVEN
jgi:hypothetical protein